MRARFFENVFCPVRLIVDLGMNRDKDATFLYFALIALGFIFRDAQTDQGSSEPTDAGANGTAAKRRHDRSSGNEGPKARNG